MRVVATAGHVDHGKSTLVEALTGTDPDRFPEEKTRGLTIDLGFAFTTLGGDTVGFVDVPGHVKFVKNMLAGVGAVEVAMLVVAANEGWMPQTAEHVAILDLLGVAHGVVALTKVDLVDDETVEIARLELADELGSSSIGGWPVVAVDSLSGRGLDTLRASLTRVLADAPAARDLGRPRLWVDRVFTARGAGTVVTGTLVGGSLRRDDEVVAVPRGTEARIRSIEAGHEGCERVGPGTRVALNLAGIDRHEIRRGDAVVLAGQWAGSLTVDVELHVIESVGRRTTLAAYVGSGEHPVAFRSLDDRFARLGFEVGLPLAPGDRIVLRSPARQTTIGGAEVLDVEPARRPADARRRLRAPLHERVLASRPWLTAADLGPLAGLDATGAEELAAQLVATGQAARVGNWITTAETLETIREHSRMRVRRHHEAQPVDAGLELAALASELGIDSARLQAALADADDLVVDREVVRHRDHQADPEHDPAARAWLDALNLEPYSPPSPQEHAVDPATVRALARTGVIVESSGVWFSADALAQARTEVGDAVTERGSLTVAEIRDLLGSTRKYVLPIAAHLDASGVTRRRGDERIPGPRAQSDDASS